MRVDSAHDGLAVRLRPDQVALDVPAGQAGQPGHDRHRRGEVGAVAAALVEQEIAHEVAPLRRVGHVGRVGVVCAQVLLDGQRLFKRRVDSLDHRHREPVDLVLKAAGQVHVLALDSRVGRIAQLRRRVEARRQLAQVARQAVGGERIAVARLHVPRDEHLARVVKVGRLVERYAQRLQSAGDEQRGRARVQQLDRHLVRLDAALQRAQLVQVEDARQLVLPRRVDEKVAAVDRVVYPARAGIGALDRAAQQKV